MGEILTQLRRENMQAMKNHDTLRKGVLSLLISSMVLAEKDKGEALTKEEEYTCIQKELKQTRDALEATPASRPELIEETKQKIAILEGYLPAQMSEEEIRKAIEEIMNENHLEPTKKSQGMIMKTMMAKYRGRVDGKTVNKVLSAILN